MSLTSRILLLDVTENGPYGLVAESGMSALGQKRTFASDSDVRFTPKAAKKADIAGPGWRAEHFAPLPRTSNVDLLSYGEGIVHINAEIPHSALYLCVTKQKLDGAQIPGAAVDQRRLRSPQ